MNVMKGEILFLRAGSLPTERGRRTANRANMALLRKSLLPDADMMNREFHKSGEWALLTQALACRTLI